MVAKKNQEEDAQSERAVSSMINQEIRAFVRNYKVWEMRDFDGSIRQCLHAIHGFDGLLGIRDALDKLPTNSCGKSRVQYMNPRGYIHKILKNCVRELRQQARSKKSESKSVSVAPSSSPFAALFPTALDTLLWKPYCPPTVLPSGALWSEVWQGGCKWCTIGECWSHVGGQDEAQSGTVTSSPVLTTSKGGLDACLILATTITSTHVKDLALDQGEGITSTEASQNPPTEDAIPGADVYAQAAALFEPSEASTILSVSPRENSSQPTAELEVESFTDTDCDEEDFLLVKSFCKCDSKGEGFGQDECDSQSLEQDGFVLL